MWEKVFPFHRKGNKAAGSCEMPESKESSSKITMKNVSISFCCAFPWGKLTFLEKRRDCAAPLLWNNVVIHHHLYWNKQDYLCSGLQASASTSGLNSSIEIPLHHGAMGWFRCACEGEQIAATGGFCPWLAAKALIIITQAKDQLIRGLFLCTAKELSAIEVSLIPGTTAKLAMRTPPLLFSWATPSVSINPYLRAQRRWVKYSRPSSTLSVRLLSVV